MMSSVETRLERGTLVVRIPMRLQDTRERPQHTVPEIGFPGLKPGDCSCLCAARWKEALDAGMAPRVVRRATHENCA
jgi:hypothetical protein